MDSASRTMVSSVLTSHRPGGRRVMWFLCTLRVRRHRSLHMESGNSFNLLPENRENQLTVTQRNRKQLSYSVFTLSKTRTETGAKTMGSNRSQSLSWFRCNVKTST